MLVRLVSNDSSSATNRTLVTTFRCKLYFHPMFSLYVSLCVTITAPQKVPPKAGLDAPELEAAEPKQGPGQPTRQTAVKMVRLKYLQSCKLHTTVVDTNKSSVITEHMQLSTKYTVSAIILC